MFNKNGQKTDSEDDEEIGNFKAESMEYFEKMTLVHPEVPAGHYYLGFAYINMGLSTKAKIAWEEFLEDLAQVLLPIAKQTDKLGFCFSFPATITPEADGEVIYFNILELIVLKGVFLNHQSKDFLVGKCLSRFVNLFGSFVFLFAENFIVHAHHIQQAGSYLTLLYVLGFIVNTRTASPTNQEEHRNVIHFLISQ